MPANLKAGQRRTAAVGELIVNVRLVSPSPNSASNWLCRAELNGSLFFVRDAEMGELLSEAEPEGG